MTADTTYLVATGDGSDTNYDASRRTGLDLAERDGAAVVLYDRTGESMMTDPYPVGPWADEDDAVSADSRLEPDVLEGLGRGYLAEQLTEARGRGLDVEAYIAQGSGTDALERAIDRFQPALVVLPASVTKSSLMDKVRHNTWDDFVESVDVDIALIDDSGERVG